MSTHLSPKYKWAIINLTELAGWNQRQIANKLNCSQSTVSYTLKLYNETGDIEEREGRGRKPLVDVTDTKQNPISESIRNN